MLSYSFDFFDDVSVSFILLGLNSHFDEYFLSINK